MALVTVTQQFIEMEIVFFFSKRFVQLSCLVLYILHTVTIIYITHSDNY